MTMETFYEALSAELTVAVRGEWIDRVEFADTGETRYHYTAAFAADRFECEGRRPLYIEVSAQGAREIFTDGSVKTFMHRGGCWAFRERDA